MAQVTKLDPVQGLVDYTLEVKPYHTKIIEVLVEYIHTDRIDVEIIDELDWCINMGVPDLGALFSGAILEADPIGNTFKLSGDIRHLVTQGQVIQVALSSGNDGHYTVTNISYDFVLEETTLTVMQQIPVNISDGIITDKLIEYCPGGQMVAPFIFTPTPSISLTGGWGVQWGATRPQEIVSVNPGSQEITLAGDVLAQFIDASRIRLDYYDEDITLYTTPAEFDLIEDHHFIIVLDVTNVTFNGVNTIVTVATVPPLNVVYGFAEPVIRLEILEFNASGNTITLNGEYQHLLPLNIPFTVRFSSTGNDGRYTPIKVATVGATTVITVLENISNSTPPTLPTDGTLFVTGYGWDEVAVYSAVAEGQVRVTFNETLTFSNIGIDLRDSLRLFNMENSAGDGYGGVTYGTIVSPFEPLIPETATAPVGPSEFDLWYDTVSQKLKQWRAYQWVSISTVFWLNDDIGQLYRRTKTSYADTGWFTVSGNDSDITTDPWDVGGFAKEPYTIYHGPEDIVVDVINNAYYIRGGNFVHYFLGGTHFRGYDSMGLAGTWQTAQYQVVNIDGSGLIGTHSFLVKGNLLSTFTPGRHFYVTHTSTNEGWYTITNAVLDGANTRITVAEKITDNALYGQYDPRGLGIVVGALYDPEGIDAVQGTYSFTHDQTFEHTEWNIIHGFKDAVIVRIFDTDGTEVLPTELIELEEGHLVAKFNTPMAGLARVVGYVNIEGEKKTPATIVIADASEDFQSISGIPDSQAYVHTQATPSALWTVEHGMDPGVIIRVFLPDSGDWVEVQPYNITEPEPGIALVEFTAPFTGIARVIGRKIPDFNNPALVNAGVEMITYKWYGPLRMNIGMLPETIISPTIDSVTTISNEVLRYDGAPEVTYTEIVKGYTHTQLAATTTWTIPHGFVNSSIVRVFDGAGNEMHPASVTEPTQGTTVLTFTSPVAGTARLVGTIYVTTTEGATTTNTEASITDQLEFGWTVNSWFSYYILEADDVAGTFRVAGDQRTELQIGQDVVVSSSPGYNGTYKIQSSIFNGIDTIIQVTPGVPLAGTGGFVIPIEDVGAVLYFHDTIGVTMPESADAAVLTTGGNVLSGAFDYPYWDLSGYDEDLGTIIHLYSS